MRVTDAPSFHSYRTPFGRMTLQSHDGRITRLVLGEAVLEGSFQPTQVMNDAATQVNEYLAGKRTVFSIPISVSGTDFQEAVWEACANIPYGQTRTSSEIAEAIGHPGSHRAVGRAVRENPIPMLIPAHRIAGSSDHVSSKDDGDILRSRFRELEAHFA